MTSEGQKVMKELLDGSNTKYCEIKKLRIKQAS
jgi:hypothetical protein